MKRMLLSFLSSLFHTDPSLQSAKVKATTYQPSRSVPIENSPLQVVEALYFLFLSSTEESLPMTILQKETREKKVEDFRGKILWNRWVLEDQDWRTLIIS